LVERGESEHEDHDDSSHVGSHHRTDGSWPSYGARQDTANCFWYSVCAPNTLTTFQIKPVGADACGGTSNASGTFDGSKLIPTSTKSGSITPARPPP
jgi:hypothetical protein